jgi:hypothetical protein
MCKSNWVHLNVTSIFSVKINGVVYYNLDYKA